MDEVNSKSGMTLDEMKAFIRNQTEELVNRRNLGILDVNLAPDFVDHGADVPPGTPPGKEGIKQYVGNAFRRFPDFHSHIEDVVAEDDRVAVRYRWTGTHARTGDRIEFCGIMIWRIASRKIVERWAYLEPMRTLSS